ncbi:MAG: HlyC/CorC family transporter [Gammaproteobacteria bacterium]
MSELPTGLLFTLLIFLLMCSAFFSSSETALMMLNRYRLKHLVEEGHRGARRALRLLETPERLIGLILLGNNFVNILASALATIIALRLGGEAMIAAATGILTFVVLIYAEVIPKTFAAMHPERIAYPAAAVYTLLLKPLFPVVWLVNRVTTLHLRMLGVRSDNDGQYSLSQDELRTVVNEATALIPQRHRQMLIGLLDLEKTTVEDIMIPRNEVSGIDLQDPLDDIEEYLENTHFTRLLVFDGSLDKIVGQIHARRLLRLAMRGDLTKERIIEQVKPPYYIPEGTSLSTLIKNFQRDRRRIGLVVDEYGDLQGLVTFGNIIEQIVGEFTTTPTASISDVNEQEDGSFLVKGSANVRELVKITGWKLPTDGPKTLNGLILEHMENIPEPNTSMLLAGYPVEILQTEDNMVKVVRLNPKLRKRKSNKG